MVGTMPVTHLKFHQNMKIILLSLALVLFAFGCSKKDAEINLGVIELVPNSPKHLNVGGTDWTITETLGADGKPTITAKSTWKVTQEDISSSAVPPGTKVGATFTMTMDMSDPPSHKITGYFRNKLAHYTLKYDAK